MIKARRKRSADAYIYTKKEKVYCSDMYNVGDYGTFTEAKTACANDANCGAVYDDGCDDTDSFTLCPINYAESTSVSSCLYLKQGNI